MRKYRLLVVAVCMTAVLLTASASHAQQVLIGVGSSGVFGTTAISAIAADPVTAAPALCGTNIWSGGGSSASSLSYAIDGRNPAIPHEPGSIWVAWDNDTSPNLVCAYLSVDSVVGDRLFLSQNTGGAGNATLNLSATAQYTVGANKVAFVQDNTSCVASGGPGPTAVNITEPNLSSTATVTVYPSGNFGNDFANNAVLTIAGSTVAAFDISGGTILNGSVTQLGPSTFQYTTSTENTTGSTLSDNSGSATATVTANCPGVPLAVYNLINGKHFTVAFTDIRPEDAHFTFVRATCGFNATDPTTQCLGYSKNPSGPQAVMSSYSQGVAYGLDFALFGGTDPISSYAVPAGTIVDIGAVPIIWFVGIQDTSACGLGNAAFTNVNIMDLQNVYTGQTGGTQDISPALIAGSPCPTALHPLTREPFSGTYNTVEWQVIRSFRDGQNEKSQEMGNVGYPQSNNNLGTACATGEVQPWVSNLPASTPSNPSYPPFGAAPVTGPQCGNPLNIQAGNYPAGTPALGPYSGYGGNRTRVIGTGEMIAVGNSTNTKNAIGYAFYSLGNFGNKTNIKYITLDGAEPLWPTYGGNPYGAGNFPSCSGKINGSGLVCSHGQPSFDGIQTGRYSNWNVIRALYYGSVATCTSPFGLANGGAACLIQAAQDQANPVSGTLKDYVPVQYCSNGSCSSSTLNLLYWRAHYSVCGVLQHNGLAGPPYTPSCPSLPEGGGDVAGAIFPIALEVERLNSIGCTVEFTGYYQ